MMTFRKVGKISEKEAKILINKGKKTVSYTHLEHYPRLLIFRSRNIR